MSDAKALEFTQLALENLVKASNELGLELDANQRVALEARVALSKLRAQLLASIDEQSKGRAA